MEIPVQFLAVACLFCDSTIANGARRWWTYPGFMLYGRTELSMCGECLNKVGHANNVRKPERC